MLSIIAVIGKNRELGKDNHLLWNIPADLARFRQITKGHPVIMGRKTYESIGHPLPQRTNIIITGDSNYSASGSLIASSLTDGVKLAEKSSGKDEIFVIGGGSIYAQAIALADRLYLTVVDEIRPDADTYFPDFKAFTKVISSLPQSDGKYHFTYLTLER